MIALLQRVNEARVCVDGEIIGEIGAGLLVFAGFACGDDDARTERMLERILAYRVFPDERGRMNRDLRTIEGGLLLVPQFTLAADTRKGRRPGFETAARPEVARALFARLRARAAASHQPVAFGRFGADMQVGLVNDGPVTFILSSGDGEQDSHKAG